MPFKMLEFKGIRMHSGFFRIPQKWHQKYSSIFWAIPFHYFLRLYGRLMKNLGGLREQRAPSELCQNAQ